MSDTTTAETTAETDAPEAEETSTESFDQDRAMAKIRKANDEAKGLRARVKELEALEAKVRDYEESQKSEAEKVQERAAKAEQRALAAETELIRERIARRHQISDDDLELLGTGTEDQIEARAKRIAALQAAAVAAKATVPPSDKPVEKLRPGATSTDDDITSPDAYPSSWRTARTLQTRKD
jgi:seryl-tRNA(Sec) selenium transferase